MNYKMIMYLLGQLLRLEGILMLIPLFYVDSAFWALLGTALGLILVGTVLTLKKPESFTIGAKEGFAITGLSWLLLSMVGALPFCISGAIPNYIDALFETISGITTTGATILTDIEALDRGLLFWRAFTHWIGGMGVLVFMLVVLPRSEIKSTRMMYVLRAEMPGPKVGKVTAKLRKTAGIMYLIYLALTVLLVGFLLAGGMDLYDSLTNALSTAGTGGFCVRNASIADYNSAYVEYVIAIFMLLFSINFNLYFLIVTGHVLTALKSEELRGFLLIFISAVALIVYDIYAACASFSEAFRLSFFQVSAIMSTTGFITADFNNWPALSKGIILFLTMVGACAGSTGGGLKVGRLIMLIKSGVRELRYMLSPRSVVSLKFEDRPVEPELIRSTTNYFLLYVMLGIVSMFAILVADGTDIITTFTSVLTCINNVGPGLNLVGPVENYAHFSAFSKIVLSFDMLAGRLELFPMLFLLTPATWRSRT